MQLHAACAGAARTRARMHVPLAHACLHASARASSARQQAWRTQPLGGAAAQQRAAVELQERLYTLARGQLAAQKRVDQRHVAREQLWGLLVHVQCCWLACGLLRSLGLLRVGTLWPARRSGAPRRERSQRRQRVSAVVWADLRDCGAAGRSSAARARCGAADWAVARLRRTWSRRSASPGALRWSATANRSRRLM